MPDRVSTLELFFDLVFVLIVGQLTAVLAHDPDLEHLARVTVVLALVWWMYGGYAWLTNSVATEGTARRLALLAGMAAFFLVALVVPTAFDDQGYPFAVAYLVVVVIHIALYSRATGITELSALWRLGRWNLLAVLGLGIGAVGGGIQLAVWAGVAVVQWGVIGYRTGDPESFAVRPAHFVERHGLVVIVAIGESVVVLGLGLADAELAGRDTLFGLLGLALCACLWWTYFGGDEDVTAEAALEAAPVATRFRMALEGFGHAHLGLLLAVVAVAAGLEAMAHAPEDGLELANALLLGGGAAGYLLADAGFRARLGLGSSWLRVAATVPLAASAFVGVAVTGSTQVGVMVGVFVIVFMLEARSGRGRRAPAP
ncbi:MAG TPA: low temperature requirement protein A [Iamia sp.]